MGIKKLRYNFSILFAICSTVVELERDEYEKEF